LIGRSGRNAGAAQVVAAAAVVAAAVVAAKVAVVVMVVAAAAAVAAKVLEMVAGQAVGLGRARLVPALQGWVMEEVGRVVAKAAAAVAEAVATWEAMV